MNAIPRIIHYCWFGVKPKPALVLRCIDSWRKFAPGFEIREWNEESLPEMRKVKFASQALAAGKWAFASDWARFKVLYDHGGLYFDTDVELIRPIESIVADGEFIALEVRPRNESVPLVAPGLGMALRKGSPLAKAMLDVYGEAEFSDETVGNRVTALLGTQMENVAVDAVSAVDYKGEKIVVYPSEYFSPIASDGKMHMTENTVAIHHYAMSWAGPRLKIARWLSWHGMEPLVKWVVKLNRGRASGR